MPDISDIKGYYGSGFEETHPDLDDDNKCCSQSMAMWLLGCNIILIILSLFCFAIGIYISTLPGAQFAAGSLGVGCIFLGVFLLLVGGIGVTAACSKGKCLLGIYSTLLLIFIIAQLAALVVAISATSIAVGAMTVAWDGLATSGGEEYLDLIGLFYGCCAVADTSSLVGQYDIDINDPANLCQGEGAVTALTGECMIQALPYNNEMYETATFAAYSDVNTFTPSINDTNGNAFGAITYKAFCEDYAASMDKLTFGAVSAWNGGVQADSQDALDQELAAHCTCAYNQDASNPYTADATCRQMKGAIPYCNPTVDVDAPFTFVVGVADDQVNLDGDRVSAAIASCYIKFENFLASNFTASIAILAIFFIYQLFNCVFAFALWCGACKKNKSESDPVASKPSEV